MTEECEVERPSDGKYRYNKVSILQGQLSISIDKYRYFPFIF